MNDIYGLKKADRVTDKTRRSQTIRRSSNFQRFYYCFNTLELFEIRRHLLFA